MLVVGVVFDLTRFELTWIRLGQRFSFKWRVGKLVLARIRSLELLPNRRADYYTAKFLNDNAIHDKPDSHGKGSESPATFQERS